MTSAQMDIRSSPTAIFLLFLLALVALQYADVNCRLIATDYRCNCVEIGLDSVWSDTNDVSCYRIPVHRDPAKSNGASYSLAAVVAHSKGSNPQQPVLYLHGGPGIATLSNCERYLKSETFMQLRESHPIVFFDYRGTGWSEPKMCDGHDSILNSLSREELPLAEAIKRNAAAYSDCKDKLVNQGIDVADFSSLQSAADAEGIRIALGIDSWNVYGVSHGTTVALYLMRSFPEAIRAVIIDSPFPPNAPWLDYVHPFDTCFKVIEADLRRDTTYARVFPSIRTDFVKIAERLRTAPLKISAEQSEGTSARSIVLRESDFAWSIWSAMINPKYIRFVPMLLKEVAAGNDSLLSQWMMYFNDPDSFGEFSNAQSRAIMCYEGKPRFEEETEAYLLRAFPDFSSFIILGMDEAICEVMRPQSPPEGYFRAVESEIPTLILAGEFDPVCPPLFAEITSATLPKSTVIIVPGASHAAINADNCIRTIATDFLLEPNKQPNTECVAKREKIKYVTTAIDRFPQ